MQRATELIRGQNIMMCWAKGKDRKIKFWNDLSALLTCFTLSHLWFVMSWSGCDNCTYSVKVSECQDSFNKSDEAKCTETQLMYVYEIHVLLGNWIQWSLSILAWNYCSGFKMKWLKQWQIFWRYLESSCCSSAVFLTFALWNFIGLNK